MAKLLDPKAPMPKPKSDEVRDNPMSNVPFAVIDGHVAVPLPMYDMMIDRLRQSDLFVAFLQAVINDYDDKKLPVHFAELQAAKKSGKGLFIYKDPAAQQMIATVGTPEEIKKLQASLPKEGKPS